MPTVLIIDDNATHRLIYKTWLEKLCVPPYRTIEASNAEDGVKLIITEQPDCVLLDYMMIGEDGFQMLHQIKHDLIDCPPIIFVTCALEESLKRNALALGAYACFDKGKLGQEELCRTVAEAIAQRVAT